jgi:hypothetical protein
MEYWGSGAAGSRGRIGTAEARRAPMAPSLQYSTTPFTLPSEEEDDDEREKDMRAASALRRIMKDDPIISKR